MKVSCPFFVFIKIGFLVKTGKNQVLGWFWDGFEAGTVISIKKT